MFKTPGSHGELRLDRAVDPWRIELVSADAERGVISSRLFVVGGDGAVAQVQVSGVIL